MNPSYLKRHSVYSYYALPWFLSAFNILGMRLLWPFMRSMSLHVTTKEKLITTTTTYLLRFESNPACNKLSIHMYN